MTGRRGLVLVVLACAAAAALVLFGAGRTWQWEVMPRPAPLPELRTAHTGGALRPWLPALGWVALAGAGALIATRGLARRAVGGLLVLAGAGIAAGALTAELAGWPVLVAVGGLAVAAAGVLAIGSGGRWPAMGARYERPGRYEARGRYERPGRYEGPGRDERSGRYEGPGRDGAGAPAGAGDPADQRPERLWEALDRGEDPTA